MISSTISFADIAHQNLTFDCHEEPARLILDLLSNRWMQRLRRVSQTGNTKLVYMFAEHSRFGHSLGVAYLANTLLKELSRKYPTEVAPYNTAVVGAALLHDVGHLAPGSHLAEQVWGQAHPFDHESLSVNIIQNDPELRKLLESYNPELPELISKILQKDSSLPEWTTATISGDGWNADRGNWSIVDSALCAVTYGRYNVNALLDSFRLSADGKLVIAENRMDALCHFFVARDSMYRQIYQHRVSQSADGLTKQVVIRILDALRDERIDNANIGEWAKSKNMFCDAAMSEALSFARDKKVELELSTVFRMTEDWWAYHLSEWCSCSDPTLRDLAQRIRDRKLLKTLRVEDNDDPLIQEVKTKCQELGFDPKYYCLEISSSDLHRAKLENPPLVLLENGEIVPVTEIEPIIANLFQKSFIPRLWIAIPKEVKEALGKIR